MSDHLMEQMSGGIRVSPTNCSIETESSTSNYSTFPRAFSDIAYRQTPGSLCKGSASCVRARQDDDLSRQAQDLAELGKLAASEARQRAEERKGRTEAERRLRAEKQVERVLLHESFF